MTTVFITVILPKGVMFLLDQLFNSFSTSLSFLLHFVCVYIISYVVSSEGVMVIHTELSRVEPSTSPSARRVEHGLHGHRVITALSRVFKNIVLGHPQWRLRRFTCSPAWAVYLFEVCTLDQLGHLVLFTGSHQSLFIKKNLVTIRHKIKGAF